MTPAAERDRPWPPPDALERDAIVAFLGFLHLTAVNKVAGLDEAQARATPIESSPVLSLLGLVKHLTAVQRAHIQREIGGLDLPELWRHDDFDFDFRVGDDETIASVMAAFDAEWTHSQATLAVADWEADCVVHGEPVRVARLVVDVLQESARHVGHIDIVRELIDGAKGE
jgi:hypothetical protein